MRAAGLTYAVAVTSVTCSVSAAPGNLTFSPEGENFPRMLDEKRKHILPELIRFASDPQLDSMTRSWIFDALREISGQDLGHDSHAWRNWYKKLTGESIAHAQSKHALISEAWLQH